MRAIWVKTFLADIILVAVMPLGPPWVDIPLPTNRHYDSKPTTPGKGEFIEAP